ncbi:hypothetical protein HNP25_002545 [Arcicella rosea]|uniref:Uncharacterized protein n=1 Tax=Arcicella rosea TaxID=502909 RepID=A0A841ELS3_9BACT|nr:hypothetical protein [Arcicella rosea]
MIKLFSQVIKVTALGFLTYMFFIIIYEHLEMKSPYKNTIRKDIIIHKYGSLQYSLESRDTINRIIMQNSYSGKFHEIILPKGTIVKSLKIN